MDWRKNKWLIAKDAENIVQITIHIARIATIYLVNRLEWQPKEGINVENVGRQYMEDIIIVWIVPRRKNL